MFLRRALVRLLLLAVCFHTVVGLPAHEASHIQQRVARAAAAVAASSEGRLPHAPGAPGAGLGSTAIAFDVPAVFLDADTDAGVPAGLGEGGREADTPGAGSHGGALDALCAWCAAFGQIASALASPPPVPLVAAGAAGSSFARLDAVFVPRPGRWRFASRDPPPSLADRSASSS